MVVDNGSVDGSMGLLERDSPHVHVIRLPENVGFARANNIGIEYTSGDRLALLNNDTVPDAHWLAELNRALDDHGDVGSCASKMLNYWQPHLVDSAGDLLRVARAFNRGYGQPLTTELDQPELVFGACAGAAIYRRSMLQRIGLFDEFFVTNLEDTDLSFRAQLAGYRCLYVPTAVVFHKRGETKRRVGWSGFFTERNSRLFWHNHMVMNSKPTEQLSAYLAGQGLKSTRQRDSILEVFVSAGRHLSAEELYLLIKKTDRSIGYATVYRTLKLLTEAGLAYKELAVDENSAQVVGVLVTKDAVVVGAAVATADQVDYQMAAAHAGWRGRRSGHSHQGWGPDRG